MADYDPSGPLRPQDFVSREAQEEQKQAELRRGYELRQKRDEEQLALRTARIKQEFSPQLTQWIETSSSVHEDEQTKLLAVDYLAKNLAAYRGQPEFEDLRALSEKSLAQAYKFQDQQRQQQTTGTPYQVAPLQTPENVQSHAQQVQHEEHIPAQGPNRYTVFEQMPEATAPEQTSDHGARHRRIVDDMAEHHYYASVNETHEQVAVRQQPPQESEAHVSREADASNAASSSHEITDTKTAKASVVRENTDATLSKNAILREYGDGFEQGKDNNLDFGQERER
jgi:hypothetical protein